MLLHPERRRLPDPPVALEATDVELTGVVYTTIFNPFDPRKNWSDLLSAFLYALGARPDATLVLKLVVSRELAGRALEGIVGFYRRLKIEHQARVIFITEYLTDEEMLDLTGASTFYVSASRGEGANLPLQNFLAAGRPGISPRHTAMLDYFHDEIGFVVASQPEPARFPHDPDGPLTTTWHRPVWQSLYEQFRASYELAISQPRRFQALALRGREQIEDFARSEAVWPRLAAALNAAAARQRLESRPAATRDGGQAAESDESALAVSPGRLE